MKSCLFQYLIFGFLFFVGNTSLLSKGYEGHNGDLKMVLLGENPNWTQEGHKKFDLLCSAARLAIDFTNAERNLYGPDCLYKLSLAGVNNLPNISELEIYDSFNVSHHEQYTHKGWYYGNGGGYINKVDWEKRKQVLIETVRFIGNFNENEQIKIEAFAQLVYDIHILGDHENNKSGSRYTRMPLSSEVFYRSPQVNPTSDGVTTNPTVIAELLYCIQRLFREQEDGISYLIHYLQANQDYFLVKYDRPFDSYSYEERECITKEISNLSKSILQELGNNLCYLLKNERWFREAFFL